jgi:methionyl-tRNA synthetase
MAENVLVCTAWPYASGPIHLGHLAGHLIPPDIYARFRRMRGDRVVLVSGSDEHGTPITLAAEEQGVTPQQLVDRVHPQIVDAITRMGIRFDLYSRTSAEHHKRTVHELFHRLRLHGHLREHDMDATYCPKCARFLPDRYVEGVCPQCGAPRARGDQCDACGHTHDPWELGEPRCKVCGTPPEHRSTRHLFFALDNFEDELRAWIESREGWRPNVVQSTLNWLDQGLRERAVTRDISWGVPVPLEGYEDKRIYVWFEAVMGYLSTTVEWALQQGTPEAWRDFWLDPAATTVYFLGKDNIPFHTIIWPAILLGASGPAQRYNLPTNVPANEFLTLAGEQFSKSRKHAIYVHEYLRHLEPAPLRYYLTVNMPELKDTDFTIEDFVAKNNDELLGTFGNFVNRVLTFTHRNFGQVPAQGPLTEDDRAFLALVPATAGTVERHLLGLEFKAALRAVVELARAGNVYFDRQKPWDLVRSDRDRCATVLNVCVQALSGLSVLLAPFLPMKAEELHAMLGGEGSVHDRSWADASAPVGAGRALARPYPLIKKLEVAEVSRALGLEVMAAEASESKAPKAAAGAPAPTLDCPADALDLVNASSGCCSWTWARSARGRSSRAFAARASTRPRTSRAASSWWCPTSRPPS